MTVIVDELRRDPRAQYGDDAPHRDRRRRGRDPARGAHRRRGHGRHPHPPGLRQAHAGDRVPGAEPRRRAASKGARRDGRRLRDRPVRGLDPRPPAASSPSAGGCYQKRVFELPLGSRTAKGKALVNLLELQGRRAGGRRCCRSRSSTTAASSFSPPARARSRRPRSRQFANIRSTGLTRHQHRGGRPPGRRPPHRRRLRHHPGHRKTATRSASHETRCAPWGAPPAACAASACARATRWSA